jgi:hypothetical protein
MENNKRKETKHYLLIYIGFTRNKLIIRIYIKMNCTTMREDFEKRKRKKRERENLAKKINIQLG